jgi:hypothetical protein
VAVATLLLVAVVAVVTPHRAAVVVVAHLAIVGSPGEIVEGNERMNWLASMADANASGGGDVFNARRPRRNCCGRPLTSLEALV